MGWDHVEPNKFGGYKKGRNDRRQTESVHGKNAGGNRINGDHVHYHKDGVTVTKGKKKYTLKRMYCGSCGKETMHRVNNQDTPYCTHCDTNSSSYPR